jgi:hypothetical protein
MAIDKHQRVIRHHKLVSSGFVLIVGCHLLAPHLTEYVALCVNMLWLGDPSSEI